MPNLIRKFQNWLSPVKPLPVGIYSYISPPDDPRNYRLHLRLEPNGSGVLVVNASTILHLNQTAAEYAYHLIHNLPSEKVAEKMVNRYRVDYSQAKTDYQNLSDRILTLIETPDLDPEIFLDFDRQKAHTLTTSAPYRLDCAITYRLPESYPADNAPTDRVTKELLTEDWKTILAKAWNSGIMHIVFTGGEPTLRDDLLELIAYAEELGHVSGLITHGERLVEDRYVSELLQTGLDHILLLFDPSNSTHWEVVTKILAEDIFLTIHLTIETPDLDHLDHLLKRLKAMGVSSISLSCNRPELEQTLQKARELLAIHDLNLVWNLPVPYSAYNPIAFETSQWNKHPGAGKDWLYLEPDGDVLPAQGMNPILGNFLQDPWEKIWTHPK